MATQAIQIDPLEAARREGRAVLLEHEAYGLLAAAGIPTPRCSFGRRLCPAAPGDPPARSSRSST
jgi:hypothetical protein